MYIVQDSERTVAKLLGSAQNSLTQSQVQVSLAQVSTRILAGLDYIYCVGCCEDVAMMLLRWLVFDR